MTEEVYLTVNAEKELDPCHWHTIEERIADLISMLPEKANDRKFSMTIKMKDFELDQFAKEILERKPSLVFKEANF